MHLNRHGFRTMLATLCAAAVIGSASAAELLDRAVLPADTFSPGPTSGQYASGANGRVLPLINKQPVQGFSAVLRGPAKGTYLVMSDNGFGAKATWWYWRTSSRISARSCSAVLSHTTTPQDASAKRR